MYKIVVGATIGVVITAASSALYSSTVEKHIDNIFYFGSIFIFFIAVLITAASLVVPKIARAFFKDIVGKVESGVDSSFEAIKSLLHGQPVDAVDHSKKAALEIAAWYAKSAYRAFIAQISIAALVAFGGFLGATILIRQNQLLQGQNELQTKQTELLNQQTDFLRRQTDLQSLQTNAARFEQYNNISREINETKPYLDALNETATAFESAKNIRANIFPIITDFMKYAKFSSVVQSGTYALYARQVSRISMDGFRISSCYDKSRSLPMAVNPCTDEILRAAIERLLLRNEQSFPPNALTFLGIYSDSRLSIVSIFDALKAVSEPDSLQLSKIVKQCRSDWDPSLAEFTLRKLWAISENGMVILNTLRNSQDPPIYSNQRQSEAISELIKSIYDLGTRHEIVLRRYPIANDDAFAEIDLKKSEMIIGLSYEYLNTFAIGLKNHCKKTLSTLKDMSDKMDPIRDR